MSDELLINRVRSRTVDIPGRSLNSARTNHWVIDEPPHHGGPGEAITPAESFLAGVAACGVLLVQSFAREEGVPVEHVDASLEGVRHRENPADFVRLDLRFEITGPTQEQAERLVEAYQHR